MNNLYHIQNNSNIAPCTLLWRAVHVALEPKTTHQLGGFVLLHIHYSYLIDVIIMRLYCWRWPRSLWTRFLAL